MQARAIRPTLSRALIVAACVIGAALPHGPAQAQNQFRVARTMGDGATPSVTSAELKQYAQILGLTPDQHAAAQALLEAYDADFQAAAKAMQGKLKAIRDEFQESRDPAVFEDMGPITEKFSKRAKELETTFLGDLKVLLTDDQAQRWPVLERTRRRERTLSHGMVNGESVDLVKIVKGLDLPPQAMTPLGEPMQQYEADLDRALIERNKIAQEQQQKTVDLTPGRPIQFDLTAMQESMAKTREAGAKVRDVNQKYARQLKPLLPEDVQPRFETEVKRATYPEVYRPSHVAKVLDAARAFDDLDAKQREGLGAIRSTYERELDAVNERWAAALADAEAKGSAGGISIGGVGMMFFSSDDSEDSPVNDARKARRELDKRTLDNVEAMLTEPQKEKLPKRGDGSGGMMGGGQQIIRIGGGG